MKLKIAILSLGLVFGTAIADPGSAGVAAQTFTLGNDDNNDGNRERVRPRGRGNTPQRLSSDHVENGRKRNENFAANTDNIPRKRKYTRMQKPVDNQRYDGKDFAKPTGWVQKRVKEARKRQGSTPGGDSGISETAVAE